MSSCDKANEMSYKMKLTTSIIIYYANFTLGLGSAFIPAALLELSRKFDTDVATISKVFTVLTFSFLLGAIVSGFVLNFLNRQIASPLMLITLGTVATLVPMCPSLPVFFILASIVGATCAIFSTAQVVWIIDLWQRNAAFYIQIQHFSFALGTIFSPLVMKFYLPERTTTEEFKFTASNSTDLLLDSTTEVNDLLPPPPDFYVPFLMGGMATMFGGILFLALYFYTCRIHQNQKKCEKEIEKPATEGGLEPAKATNAKRTLLILLSACVLGAYQGMEVCSFQFVPTFTHFIDLNLSQPEGSLVLSALAVAFTLGRAVGILVILKIRPQFLLVTNFALVLLGNSLLLIFANSSVAALWSGILILGVGFSTIVPSFYGFIEKQMKVCNNVGAVMSVASGLAPTVYPLIIGLKIESHPFILMYTNYFSLVICSVAFCTIYVITRQEKVRGQTASDNNVDLDIKNKNVEIQHNPKEFEI